MSTGDIINTTERLKQELEVTTQRQEIVSCFLRDYQLSNEEVLVPTLSYAAFQCIRRLLYLSNIFIHISVTEPHHFVDTCIEGRRLE